MKKTTIIVPLLLALGACTHPDATEQTVHKQTPPAPSARELLVEAQVKFDANDYDSAFALRSQAAQAGNGEAAYLVGRSYDYGQGVPCDYEKALEWYRKAAELGNADGQYAVGDCYMNGRIVEKDEAEALLWMEKSAALNHPDGLFWTGMMYAMGKGTEPRREEGLELMRRAADLGQPNALKTIEIYEMLPILAEKEAERKKADAEKAGADAEPQG